MPFIIREPISSGIPFFRRSPIEPPTIIAAPLTNTAIIPYYAAFLLNTLKTIEEHWFNEIFE
jgi:hypothetical protein